MDPEILTGLRWPRDRERIYEIQEEVRRRVRIEALTSLPSTIAGVDASFTDAKIISATCLMSFPGLKSLEESSAVIESEFPYISGYLSFREGPAIAKALKGLKRRPELLIFDGQGIAHPKGLGIAAFMGALLDMPSIGCAKTRLVGEYVEPGPMRGDASPLIYKGVEVGAVLRTQDNTRPLFVSPGHRIDIKGAIKIVLESAPRYRLTEPVRRADALSRKLKMEMR